jgi:hypothetical protein
MNGSTNVNIMAHCVAQAHSIGLASVNAVAIRSLKDFVEFPICQRTDTGSIKHASHATIAVPNGIVLILFSWSFFSAALCMSLLVVSNRRQINHRCLAES